jgi:hypothetical protein
VYSIYVDKIKEDEMETRVTTLYGFVEMGIEDEADYTDEVYAIVRDI